MKQRVEEVKIERFNKKGDGLGSIIVNEERKQVEVPFTIPGDHIKTTLYKKKSGRYLGRLEEIVTPSEQRIPPQCLHFGTCGGCRWQQMEYGTQLSYKEQTIKGYFEKLLPTGFIIDPIVPCDPPWHYRNKMEFSFSSDAEGTPYLGLVISGSRGKVLNNTECHLCNPWFIDALDATRKWWQETSLKAYHPYRNTGSLRTLTVREGQRTGDRMVMLTVSGNPDYALTKEQIQRFVTSLKEAVTPEGEGKLSLFLRIHQIAKGMRTQFYEMLLDGPDQISEILYITTHEGEEPAKMTFKISPSAFFQPNTRQAEKLYSHALQLAEIPRNGIVYDLYCGTGTLGICCAPFSKEVIGIEISPESALDARTNITDNQLNNVRIIEGSVEEKLKELTRSREGIRPDLIVVDPPRVGLDKVATEQIIALNPPKILYISCNPTTQADDVAILMNHGYRIKSIRPVDQFSHTYHIENIVVLENKNNMKKDN